jgi:hypothetical protein
MGRYEFHLIDGKTSEPIAVETLPDDLAAQRHASHLGIELFGKQPDIYRGGSWKVRASDAKGVVVHEAPVMEGELHPIK